MAKGQQDEPKPQPEEEKFTYRVREGRNFGRLNQYHQGDTLELTKREAKGLEDLLELVKEEKGKLITNPAGQPEVLSQQGNHPDTGHEIHGPNNVKVGEGESGDAGGTLNVDEMTVEDVLTAVSDGRLSAKDALAAEKKGKGRVTLVAKLEELVQ